MSLPTFHMIPGAPDPVAPFSHAVELDGWVEGKTRQVMENLSRVLAGCELGLENVVAARVFLARFEEDYERMNEVYASYFAPGKCPARTCVGVTALARGASVEIDLIACRR